MEFTEREIAELASFFTKRFPTFEDRARIAEQAGLAGEVQLSGVPLEVWRGLVRQAAVRDRLVRLADVAARQRPEDGNLAEMAEILRSGRRWRTGRLPLLVGGALAVVVAGVVLAVVQHPGRPSPDEPAEAAVASGAPVTEPAGDPVAVEGEVPAAVVEPVVAVAEPVAEPVVAVAEPVAEPVVAAAEPVVAVAEPVAEPAAAVAEPVAEPVVAAAKAPVEESTRGRCTGTPGGMVGYWYAGAEKPGAAGEVITVRSGANVRREYPSNANGFNSRTPVICALRSGDRVRISGEPVYINGGAWWVPLADGDWLGR